MSFGKLTVSTLAVAAISATAAVAQERTQIRIVGSSTVFPFGDGRRRTVRQIHRL